MFTRLLVVSGLHPVWVFFYAGPCMVFVVWLVLGLNFNFASDGKEAGVWAIVIVLADLMIGFVWHGQANSRTTQLGEIKIPDYGKYPVTGFESSEPTKAPVIPEEVRAITVERSEIFVKTVNQLSEDLGRALVIVPSLVGKIDVFWPDIMIEGTVVDPGTADHGMQVVMNSFHNDQREAEYDPIVQRFGAPAKRSLVEQKNGETAMFAYWDIAAVIEASCKALDGIEQANGVEVSALFAQMFRDPSLKMPYPTEGYLVLPFIKGIIQPGVQVVRKS